MTKHFLGFAFFYLGSSRFCIAVMMLVGLVVIGKASQAAWYEDHKGKDWVVHYVHLTGHDGDNDVNRRNLLIDYQACVDTHVAFGQAYNPLSVSSIPADIVSEDIELYYSSNRVLRLSQSTITFINQAACDLDTKSKRILELNSVIGSCKVDLSARKAIGACDEKAQERAPDSTLTKTAPAKMAPINLNKLPPNIRAQVAAQLARLNKLPQGPAGLNGAALVPTGSKTVANLPCTIYGAKALSTDICIAHPKSDFLIPASLMNGGIPGLLLEVNSPALTLHAVEVKKDVSVAKSFFAIPSGIKVTNVRVPREEQ